MTRAAGPGGVQDTKSGSVDMRAQSPLTAAPMRFEVASVKFPADQSIVETRPRRTVNKLRLLDIRGSED